MKRAFSLIEAILTLGLVSLILGLIVDGYSRIGTIRRASESGSKRIEILAALNSMGPEIQTALSLSIVSSQHLQLRRIDPTLNTTYNESRQRLPWPFPASLPYPAPANPARDPYLIQVDYEWVADPSNPPLGNLTRRSAGVGGNATPAATQNVIKGLSSVQMVLRADPHLIDFEFQLPNNSTLLKTTFYLPLVAP